MPREEWLSENPSQWKHFHEIMSRGFDPSAFRTCLLDRAFWSCLVMFMHQYGYSYSDVYCQFWYHLHQPKSCEVPHSCIVLPFFLGVISRCFHAPFQCLPGAGHEISRPDGGLLKQGIGILRCLHLGPAYKDTFQTHDRKRKGWEVWVGVEVRPSQELDSCKMKWKTKRRTVSDSLKADPN